MIFYELLELTDSDTTYELAGLGQLDCSHLNGKVISDCSECEVAADKLGFSYSRDETDSNYPTGCYVLKRGNFRVYCNIHSIGAREDDSSPICKVGGNFILESILS